MMPELIIVGATSGTLSLFAFGRAAVAAVRQTQLRSDEISRVLHRVYDDTLAEPVPDDMLRTVDRLRGSGL